MILLLGGSGYVGNAFKRLLENQSVDFCSVSRSQTDYTERDELVRLIRDSKAGFVINAAGYTGKPNVDACELHKADCIAGNAVLPGIIQEACGIAGIPWGHVSSGCIYTGNNSAGTGFTESDAPNFCFRTDNCSFYSGCKALGEECLQDSESTFIWRLRIPFDHNDSGRNYLSKLMRYQRLLIAENSISQLAEFVSACWECWARRVPFGIYNVTNTGSITTQQATKLLKQHLVPDKTFEFFSDESEFMQIAAQTPRSNCVMNNSKLLATGIAISDVEEAIETSLKQWKWEGSQAP